MAPSQLSASQIHLQAQIQRLQTVAVEASSLLRSQSIHAMQAQTIRLEQMADTEIEDSAQLDACMNELMLCILYAELRKDIRQVADALEAVQTEMYSSRQPTRLGSASQLASGPIESSADEMVTAESQDRAASPDPRGLRDPPASARSETFQTARGVPLVLSSERVAEEVAEEVADPAEVVEENERKLAAACMEIDEWRRTPCVRELIDNARGGDAASTRSAASARLPLAHLLEDIRGRQQRGRAQSVGQLGLPPSSPPLSRLLQAEREAALRVSATNSHMEPHSPPTHSLQPWGQPQPTHSTTLRLIDSTPTASRYQTIVDDVRLIGWVTRGSRLDVHTEFKVLVHLTRGENLTVMRRYTDFELLRDVLCERFRTFSKRIPALPKKRAFGKFEDRFLKKRESGLQFFLAYVMLHPVIGCSSIIRQWLDGPASW
ncbi:hypothetical protein H4S01_001251 [Coemansia sp. RSA 2610]|nr:hypothetical protein H4S01_001251 [Coemansia sp. RSA 2610]